MSDNMDGDPPPQQTPADAARAAKKEEKHLKRKREVEMHNRLKHENARIRHEKEQDRKEYEETLRNLERRLQESQSNPKRKKTDSDDEDDTEDDVKNAMKIALHTGKRITIQHKLWVEDDALSYIPRPVRDDTASDSDVPEEITAKTKADAELIWRCTPEHIRSYLSLAKVKRKLRDGFRVRSQIVSQVTDTAPEIFGVNSTDFVDFKKKDERAKLPMVRFLLNNHRFLYDRAPETEDDCIEGYMKHPCILRILRVTLNGKTAVTSGERAGRARTPYGALLGIHEVTLPMLAFAATIAYFVLSSQSELSREGTDKYPFEWFYESQIRTLEGIRKSSLSRKKWLDELLDAYNKDLFPIYHDDQPHGELQKLETSFMEALHRRAEREKADTARQEAEEREARAAEVAAQERRGEGSSS